MAEWQYDARRKTYSLKKEEPVARASSPGVKDGDLLEWMTITEVCAYLRIGRMSLLKIRNEGRIKSYYPHGAPVPGDVRKSLAVRFKREEVVKYLDSQGV